MQRELTAGWARIDTFDTVLVLSYDSEISSDDRKLSTDPPSAIRPTLRVRRHAQLRSGRTRSMSDLGKLNPNHLTCLIPKINLAMPLPARNCSLARVVGAIRMDLDGRNGTPDKFLRCKRCHTLVLVLAKSIKPFPPSRVAA